MPLPVQAIRLTGVFFDLNNFSLKEVIYGSFKATVSPFLQTGRVSGFFVHSGNYFFGVHFRDCARPGTSAQLGDRCIVAAVCVARFSGGGQRPAESGLCACGYAGDSPAGKGAKIPVLLYVCFINRFFMRFDTFRDTAFYREFKTPVSNARYQLFMGNDKRAGWFGFTDSNNNFKVNITLER
jgi:hypothetical protein